MYADPLAERIWSRLGGTHTSRSGTFGARPQEPLSNTPGFASVGEKKSKKKRKKSCLQDMVQAGVAWIIRKRYARPSQSVAECIQQ